ncbi:MAG: ABC transporter substrate-binding protein, partial [Candidatus Binatia bacterium]
MPAAIVCAISTIGCPGRESPQTPLVIGLESMPQNLDPRFATDAASARIGDLVFRSLTQRD